MKVRLALAAVTPFIACAIQALLWDDWIKPYVWFLFFPAAFAGAWLGGLYGGVVSTLLSVALADYVFIPPHYSFALESRASAFSIAVFIIMGLLLAQLFERLRQSQSLLRAGFDAIFEQAAVGMALVALDGHWLRVNRKLCAIIGYSQEELLGGTFQDITHPEDLEADLDNVRQMLAGEITSFSMEKRYIHKNGSAIWANLTVGLAWKPEKRPDFFVAVIEDISSRKAIEISLGENERRLKEANRLANLGHWQWDCARDFYSWSPEVFSIFGRDPALAPAGYPEVQEYFTAGGWAVLSAAVKRCRRSGVPYACDVEVIRPDGGLRWITACGQAVRSPSGALLGMHGTIQDITARKSGEEEIRARNAELELVNQASVGRELRMIELKRDINRLARELGREPPYDLSFANPQQERVAE